MQLKWKSTVLAIFCICYFEMKLQNYYWFFLFHEFLKKNSWLFRPDIQADLNFASVYEPNLKNFIISIFVNKTGK